MEKENQFQKKLIKELKDIFPGCIILKNDANYIQGIPDLLLLIKDKWIALECKRSKSASLRPNQQYYIDKMNSMSKKRKLAYIIYPENKEEVINEIQKSQRVNR